MAKKRIQKTRGRGVTPGERVTTLSDEKNDENVSYSSKKKKKKNKKSKKIKLQTMKNKYGYVESAARNRAKMETIGGLFAIFVAKLIIYNAVVYSTKHHNTGQFSLTKLKLSVKNAN